MHEHIPLARHRVRMDFHGFGFGFEWIWMDLHPQLGLLCGAALPGAFVSRKNTSLVFLQPCFLHSTKTIFNGTRLDRRGLKSDCVRFEYGTKLRTSKFKIEIKHGWGSQVEDLRLGEPSS